jgi:hypothetical protein
MMRFACRLLILVPALALTLYTVPSVQGDADSDFTSLFNGTDLTGWRYAKETMHRETETPDKRFSVAGGVIVLAARNKEGKTPASDLWTIREFAKDFVLKFEFRAAQEATGFVLIRNQAFPVGDFIRRGEYPGLKKFKTGDWNEVEVTVKMHAHAEGKYLNEQDTLEITYSNGKATAKVNGRSVDPNPASVAVVASAMCNKEGYLGLYGVVSKGQVGFRSNSGKMEFKNIRYKELP